MVISPDISSKLAIDAKSIDDLHLMSKQNPDEALQKVAQQFEALLRILFEFLAILTLIQS